MSTEQQPIDPANDPRVRDSAHVAMTRVYHQLHDVLRRYYDANGRYIEPSGVGDGGDNTGMMHAANNDVLRKLDAEVQAARETLLALFEQIDEHKRERYGPSYKPQRIL